MELAVLRYPSRNFMAYVVFTFRICILFSLNMKIYHELGNISDSVNAQLRETRLWGIKIVKVMEMGAF